MSAGSTPSTICNKALSHLGVGLGITDLETDDSDSAAACREFYDTALLQILSKFPWKFATSYADLTLVSEYGDANHVNDEWSFTYRMPSECAFLRKILTGVRDGSIDSRAEYDIASDASGLLILTDEDSPTVEFTKFVSEEFYSADFEIALSHLIAHYIGPRLKLGDSDKVSEKHFALYLQWVSTARASDINQTQRKRRPESEFISGRE